MSYIGKTPTVGNFIKLDAITTSSTNSYTLQHNSVNFSPESANHMLVSLNGVIQAPNTSYTVSGSTITFLPSSGTLSSSDSIDFIMVYGNVLDVGVATTVADSAITNAKTNFVSTSSSAGLQIKGDGTTDGTLQLNCSQNSHGIKLKSPAHSAGASYTLTFPTTDGNADQFLQSNGSGVLTWADAGGGGLVKLAETNISSGVSTVSFDGYFTSDYDFYKVMIVNLRPVGSSSYVPSLRFRRSNSDVTSNNYRGAVQQAFNGGSNHNGDFPSTLINMVKDSSVKGNSEFGFSAEIIFYNPLKSTRYRMVNGQGTYQYSTDRWYTCQFGGTDYSATSALSGFTFLNAGGENFDDGEIYLFGIKTS
ncbi:hypothetical protein HTVC026P_gp55 [Pelagibacter phage HTVC026P]|nr:hypothetical protein HTVC026P_gp55 [Pelagibacter phage HTVC026P]